MGKKLQKAKKTKKPKKLQKVDSLIKVRKLQPGKSKGLAFRRTRI